MTRVTIDDRLPRDCTFSKGNWRLLARFWHPLAYASEVVDKPVAAMLLDQRLVIYRSGDQVVVADDVCIHRGAPLSRGTITEGCLVCPYHGLRFDSTGRCVAVPPAGPDATIPNALRLRTYPSRERYGLIWTCLRPEAIAPLPSWPALEDDRLQKIALAPATWKCQAFRHVENFNDVAHFGFIHAGTFGNPDDTYVPPYDTERRPHGLHRVLPVNQVDRDTFGGSADRTTVMRYTYDYELPFNSALVISSPDNRNEYIYDTISPVSSRISRIFIMKARDYDMDQPIEEWVRFQEAVNEEDRWVVEEQRPEEIPLDLRVEQHIAADAWSVRFRKLWSELGYSDS